jgi:phenylacetate-CoA ligase
MRRLFYGKLLYPAYHGIRRDGILPAVRALHATERARPAELEALQREKLLRLLRFADAHVPFYQTLFRERGERPEALAEPGRLRELPILTKEIIRDAGARLQASPAAGRSAYANSTSGSTGEPLRFLTDRAAHAARMADELRGKSWTGYRLGDREVSLWGAPMDVDRATRWRGRLHSLVTGHVLLSSYELGEAHLGAYAARIDRLRPQLMVAYPSALEVLARHCAEQGRSLRAPPPAIITSAETLWPHQRELFEQVFSTRVYNRYGCREVGAIAHQCRAGGMHASTDRLLVEIVDERGRACAPGEWGELLITDLDSLAMPFIRYRIGDRAAWAAAEACPCGVALPLLEGVEGRSMDAVLGRQGQRVGGTFWTILLRSRPGFRQFQVVQDTSGSISIRYVPERDLNPETLAYFTGKIRERLGEDLVVRYEAVERVPIGASGKLRVVMSDYRPKRAVNE